MVDTVADKTKRPPVELTEFERRVLETHRKIEDKVKSSPLGYVFKIFETPGRWEDAARLGLAENIAGIAGSVGTVAEKIGLASDGFGERAEEGVRGAWRKASLFTASGEFDFRMAKGWKMPEGMKYNGKSYKEAGYAGPAPGEEIASFWTIFHSDKRGNIEVLDKDDPRFKDIVGPYMFAQIAAAATIGTKGLTSIKSATQGMTLAKGAATGSYLALGSADMAGGLTQAYGALKHSLVLKPEALNHFARLLDKPENMTPEQIQKDLNIVLEQYSKKSGSKTQQYYIPPLKTPAEALEMLGQMARGQVKGFVRDNPFAEISKSAKTEDIGLLDVRNAVISDPHFRRSFSRLAMKALEGKPLIESEKMALRFGVSMWAGNIDEKTNLPMVAKGSSSEADLHSRTMKILRETLSEPILRAEFASKELAKGNTDNDEIEIKWLENMRDALEGKKPAPLASDASLIKDLAKKIDDASFEITASERPKNPIIANRGGAFGFN